MNKNIFSLIIVCLIIIGMLSYFGLASTKIKISDVPSLFFTGTTDYSESNLSINSNMTSTYTPHSETHCLNNTCNITFYSKQKFIENNGTWQTITEVIDFKWEGNYFKLSYKNNPNIYVNIQP